MRPLRPALLHRARHAIPGGRIACLAPPAATIPAAPGVAAVAPAVRVVESAAIIRAAVAGTIAATAKPVMIH